MTNLTNKDVELYDELQAAGDLEIARLTACFAILQVAPLDEPSAYLKYEVMVRAETRKFSWRQLRSTAVVCWRKAGNAATIEHAHYILKSLVVDYYREERVASFSPVWRTPFINSSNGTV